MFYLTRALLLRVAATRLNPTGQTLAKSEHTLGFAQTEQRIRTALVRRFTRGEVAAFTPSSTHRVKLDFYMCLTQCSMLGMNLRSSLPAVLAPAIAFAVWTAPACPQQPPVGPGPSDRGTELDQIVQAHHGKVAFYATELKTGTTVSHDPDAVVQTASVIKLAILYEAMEQVRSGKAHWDDKITLQPGDGVSGSGILLFFDAPQTFTLKDILTLMVIMSDNTASNLAMEKLGIGNINDRIAWIGLKDTHLYKKIGKPATGPMPADQPKYGLGKTTPREMAAVMERIGLCELDQKPDRSATVSDSDAAICGVAMKMLRNQFYRDTIPRYLEKLDSTETGSGTATKTGSLNAVRNDVGIVAGKTGPILISIFTYDNADTGWTADNEGELTIAKLAKAIVDAWSPAGIDGKTLVPGLGLRPLQSNSTAPPSK
jgi:beta-lactamase class A